MPLRKLEDASATTSKRALSSRQRPSAARFSPRGESGQPGDICVIARGPDPDHGMASSLQHDTASQRLALSPAGAGHSASLHRNYENTRCPLGPNCKKRVPNCPWKPGKHRHRCKHLAPLPANIRCVAQEAAMGAEEPKLEGDPDPADEVESFDECDVVDIQTPELDERSIGHARLPPAKVLRSLNQWTRDVNTSRAR